jgi:DNA polymerase-3 subunit gamma/tau
MSYLVLARKYRPQNFEQVVGQAHVTQTLKNAIQADRVAHALLFAGPRGVGKTSVARILAKAMNCKDGPTPAPCGECTACKEITDGIAVDVLEIDGASNRGIDEIRELRESIKYMPGHNRYKIYIIDEVHMLTAPAFNALLKTLEEPPPHALFVFATTEAHKIPATILSRCQRHDFKRIGLEEIVIHLNDICQGAAFEVSREGLRLLGREADGSMRDALSLLDQIMAYSEEGASEDQILDILGAVERKAIFDLSSALLTGDALKALDLLDKIHNHGHDLKRLSMQITEHFRHLIIVKMGHGRAPLVDVPAHELTSMERQVENTPLESINQIFTNLFQTGERIRFSPQPKLALEMLFIKVAQLKPVVPLDEIITKLDLLAGEKATDRGITEVKENRSKALEPQQRAHSPQLAAGLASESIKCKTSLRSKIPCSLTSASSVESLQGLQSSPPTTRDHGAGAGQLSASTEDLSNTWRQLLEAFNKRCPTLAPNLEKASLTRIDKDILEISVTGNSFYTKRLQEKKSISALQDVCSQFFGRKMRIKILEAGGKGAQGGTKTKESDKERRLRKEALSHPLVTDALDIFQGRVVDVKIMTSDQQSVTDKHEV